MSKKSPGRATAAPVAATETVNLRERQRQLGQDAILNAAEQLFQKRGFAKTTIQMIADDAGVGVATVFRHFRSKPGIVAQLMHREVLLVFERGMKVIREPGDDPGQAMVAFLLVALSAANVPAARLEGTERLWLPLPFGHEDTDRFVRWGDSELKRHIVMLLQHYRDVGRLRSDLRIEDLAFIVFAVFNQHYIGISTGDDPSPRDAARELRKQIPLLFEPWLVAPGVRRSRADR